MTERKAGTEIRMGIPDNPWNWLGLSQKQASLYIYFSLQLGILKVKTSVALTQYGNCAVITIVFQ